jgi:UDP-N-acetylglucosamine 2-epimerase (non-hydrolysing)
METAQRTRDSHLQKGNKLKVSIIVGTRPEIIKMSPLVKALQDTFDCFILHTGQHYSYNMDKVFFEQLNLPPPKYNLDVGSGTHAEETGRMLMGIEKILTAEKPYAVLVEGDTNSVLAGALAASKLQIKVGHVEAGLRSYDRSMPEETNRVLTDHISDYLFAPTETAKRNLLKEGLSEGKIFVTGNTIVDAVYQNLKLAKNRDIKPLIQVDGYFLVTLHRQENVDNPEKLRAIMKGLELISEKFGKTIVYPIHPRTRKRLRQYLIGTGEEIKLLEPTDYFTFLKLESEAEMILTDSGGVQEEACILKVPCVTLRNNTERPETVEVGANIVAGTNPKSVLEKVSIMMRRERKWMNPFGDGKASERIVEILSKSDA